MTFLASSFPIELDKRGPQPRLRTICGDLSAMSAIGVLLGLNLCGVAFVNPASVTAEVELELINSTERKVDIYFVHRNGEEHIGEVMPEASSTIHTYIGQHFVYRDSLSQELVGKTTVRSRKQKYIIRKTSKSDARPEKLVVERKRDGPNDGPDPLELDESEPQANEVNKQAGGKGGATPVRYPNYANQVLLLVNNVRQTNGLKPLKLDPLLCQACVGHSRDMIKFKFFSHRSPVAGKTGFWQRAIIYGTNARSENIAKGQPTPQLVMSAWMKSSGHRNNIMDPSVTRMGIGWVGMYWTQLFGQ